MYFDEEKIVNLYRSGKNTVEIANEFGTYQTSIRRVLIRNKVQLRSGSVSRNRVENNVFDLNNLTKEDYYWLGLLITDGCISNSYLSLSLKEEDCYQLQRFASYLGHKMTVNKQFNKKYEIFEYQVKVRNIELNNRLKSLAHFENKSLEAKIFTDFNYDILRGVIDGDGYVKVSKSQVSISICSASSVFIKQIEKFLLKEEIDCKIRVDNRKDRKNLLYYVEIYKQSHILKLYQNMYCNTDLFLIRKKNKYGCLLEKFKSKLPLNSGNPSCGNPEPSLDVNENK